MRATFPKCPALKVSTGQIDFTILPGLKTLYKTGSVSVFLNFENFSLKIPKFHRNSPLFSPKLVEILTFEKSFLPNQTTPFLGAQGPCKTRYVSVFLKLVFFLPKIPPRLGINEGKWRN